MTDLSFFEQAISFVLHIDQHLFALVAEYGALLYLFLFIVVFCETGLVVTPFLPGDSLLFAAGTVAGAGHLSYPVCMLVLLGAAILGDAVNYEIGRHVGPSIFSRETRFLNKEHLLKAMRFTNGMAERPLSWPGSFPSCVPLRRLWLGLRSCPGQVPVFQHHRGHPLGGGAGFRRVFPRQHPDRKEQFQCRHLRHHHRFGPAGGYRVHTGKNQEITYNLRRLYAAYSCS